MPKRTVKSCGPDASVVGVKSAEGKSARPGADEQAIRGRRRQQSPILRGEREVSRKAIAQGMSDCLRCPVCSCAIFVLPFARETAGAARIRHSLLPLLRDNETQTSGASRRENVDVYPLFDIRIEFPPRHCEFVRYRPRGRRRWTKQTPRLSPGLTGRPSIPETVVSNREAAAYWIARSSRATTVLLWQRSCKPRFQEPGNAGHNAFTIASSPSVSAAGPGCNISGDLIS